MDLERQWASNFFSNQEQFKGVQIPDKPSTSDPELLNIFRSFPKNPQILPLISSCPEHDVLLQEIKAKGFSMARELLFEQGMHVVVYGVGSKVDLIDEFADADDLPCNAIIFYGHKEPLNEPEVDKLLAKLETHEEALLIIIHNLPQALQKTAVAVNDENVVDGLLSPHTLLLRWLGNSRIRLLMSIDAHLPKVVLMNDHRIRYLDFTSFLPYALEEHDWSSYFTDRKFFSQFLATENDDNKDDIDTCYSHGMNTEIELEAARFVLSSVTENARQVFRVLLLQEQNLRKHEEAMRQSSGNDIKQNNRQYSKSKKKSKPRMSGFQKTVFDSDSESSTSCSDVEDCIDSRLYPVPKSAYMTELDLFIRARDQLLVSSEPAFKALLTEFIDHGLIRRDQASGIIRIDLNDSVISELLATPQTQ